MNTRPLYGALFGALLTIPLLAHPAAAAQEDFALNESGSDGAVVSCEPGSAAACQWVFTGTATGSGLPYGQGELDVVVELRTAGDWDAQGCQPLAAGSTVTFHRRLGHPDIGWRKAVSGTYCTVGEAGHVLDATVLVGPASRPGRYHRATGSGAMAFQDGVGNTPGDTGPWHASEQGALTF